MAKAPVVRRRRWPTIKRDTAIWLLGIGIAINEAVIQPHAQAEVLVFAAGLLGLPGILAANDYVKKVVSAMEAAKSPEGGDA